jgi:hypothetical protein
VNNAQLIGAPPPTHFPPRIPPLRETLNMGINLVFFVMFQSALADERHRQLIKRPGSVRPNEGITHQKAGIVFISLILLVFS